MSSSERDPNGRSDNHALTDYQMQLMLLEQQNAKRLQLARQEQDRTARVNGQDDATTTSSTDANPFIAFRRYADERISSFMQSILGLPSAVKQPTAHARWMDDGYDGQRRAAYQKGDVVPPSGAQGGSSSDDDGGKDGKKGLKKWEDDEEKSRTLEGEGKNTWAKDGKCGSRSNVWDHVWDPWYPGSFRPSWWDNAEASDKQAKDVVRASNGCLHEQSQCPQCWIMSDTIQVPVPSPLATLRFMDDKLRTHIGILPFSKAVRQDYDRMFPNLSEWPGWQGYLFHSRYSPIHLERHWELSKEGTKWRNAFEDLMLAEQGKPMAQRPSGSSRNDQPGQDPMEWIAALSARGSLPRPITPPPPDYAAEDEDEDDDANMDEPETELDAYLRQRRQEDEDDDEDDDDDDDSGWEEVRRPLDAYLRRRQQQNAKNERQQEAYDACMDSWRRNSHHIDKESNDNQTRRERHPSDYDNVPYKSNAGHVTDMSYTSQQHPPQSPLKPGILSTLTTTERTTLPDGTVTTKIVLKKRFADGREESSETVHTSQRERPPPVAGAAVAKGNGTKGTEQEAKEKEKKASWFWSK